MDRKTFIGTLVGAAAASVLPVPDNYLCDCGLVRYWKQPEGHFAADHFAGHRFTYARHRMHEHLHRHMSAHGKDEDFYAYVAAIEFSEGPKDKFQAALQRRKDRAS